MNETRRRVSKEEGYPLRSGERIGHSRGVLEEERVVVDEVRGMRRN